MIQFFTEPLVLGLLVGFLVRVFFPGRKCGDTPRGWIAECRVCDWTALDGNTIHKGVGHQMQHDHFVAFTKPEPGEAADFIGKEAQ